MALPDYINCQEREIEHCDYYLTRDCKNTCAYARDIGGIGIGAMVNLGLGYKVDSQKSNKVNLGVGAMVDQVVSDKFGNKKYWNGKLNPAYSNN